jgi:hypothetical protein
MIPSIEKHSLRNVNQHLPTPPVFASISTALRKLSTAAAPQDGKTPAPFWQTVSPSPLLSPTT